MGLFSERAVSLFLVAYFIGSVLAAEVDGLEKKRGVSCEKYKKIDPSHTACISQSKAKKSGVSESDKTVIVDAHNEERRIVSPSASNMMAMSWDDDLASTAQRWADTCPSGHDKSYDRAEFGKFNVGQNIAWGSPGMSWTKAVKLWADEKYDYDYNTNKPKAPGKVVGHYTQVVWATSIRVGCGYALCNQRGKDTDVFVCNYGPAGNMQGEKPYTSGTPCSVCSSSCNNKLCDCKKALCKNGGTMDPNSCSCTCKSKFYKSPDCSLDCGSGTEPPHCSGWKQYCSMMSNVPTDCPKTCGWC
ncbi:cysteine-rich secretory protein 3-like [Ruditapes philippinarum]|uniref:cysteine-rich secretory protein 3-like n=1 Tax=Ruditapes philippinarum TaxID=129788 RepID=UPI00295B2828|nr:cysteine-rich secretory protein 3-like [Ruditapes philippinarum]